MPDDLATALVKGAMYGLIATMLGWLKNASPGKFSFKGLIVKLPAGVLVGVVAASQGIQFNAALEWATGIGLVEVIDNLTKLVIRRFRPDWMDLPGGSLEYDPGLVETLTRLAEGKDITRDDVIRGTELVREAATKLLDGNDPQDKEFSEHVIFCANQIMQNARRQGWSDETYENAGKMLFRLFQVWRRYRSDKTKLSMEEWAGEMKIIVTAMQAIFRGGEVVF